MISTRRKLRKTPFQRIDAHLQDTRDNIPPEVIDSIARNIRLSQAPTADSSTNSKPQSTP